MCESETLRCKITQKGGRGNDGHPRVHTYIASEVALFLGDSELAGKAW